MVSFRVDVNPDTFEYNYGEIEPCLPDPQYMQWNPIKATLYHFDVTQARINKRVARRLLWHSEKNLGEGVEVCLLFHGFYFSMLFKNMVKIIRLGTCGTTSGRYSAR